MPAARGVKRTASKASASAAPAGPKNKKKRNVVQLEVPKAPKRRCFLLTCGQGDVGQLGLGENVMETTTFKQVAVLGNKVVDACAGGMHTVALDCDGKVWTFGCNDEGALGRPTSNEVEEGTPSTVTLPNKVVMISAGDSHSAALDEEGSVYAWGAFRDSHGSMGLVVRGKEGKPCKEPVRIDIGEQAASIASGGDHLVILTISGSVFTMGCGEQGQLGRLSQRSATRDARGGFSALLVPSKVTLKSGASHIWAGYHATFALDSAGDHMWAWGLNNYNQLGITGSKHKTAVFSPLQCTAFQQAEWSEVSAGQHHSLAVRNGETYTVGRCDYGRLGLGDRTGDAETLEVIPKLQNKTVVSISAGTSNSFAVTSTGELYAWGMGSEGQLGVGSSSDCAEPTPAKVTGAAVRVQAGGQHTVCVTLDPNYKKEATPTPDEEMAEEKTKDEEEKPDKPEKKPKGRAAKQQKMQQDQEEEISSTSGAHASDTCDGKVQKVNGDEKETAMEVDETDKPQEKVEDMKTDEKSQKQETQQKEEKMDTTDTSSQDTITSEQSTDDKTADNQKSADNDQKSADSDQKIAGSDQKNAASDQKSADSEQLTKTDEIKKVEDKIEESKKIELNGTPEIDKLIEQPVATTA